MQDTGFRIMDFDEWLTKVRSIEAPATDDDEQTLTQELTQEYADRTLGNCFSLRHRDIDAYDAWKTGRKLAPPPIAQSRGPLIYKGGGHA